MVASPGPLFAYSQKLAHPSDGSAYGYKLGTVAPMVSTEDLLDAQGVADILRLAHRNTVSQYQQRYEDMPKPVIDLGKGRVKLWLRPEIEEWAVRQSSRGRTRPKRRIAR